MSEPEPDVTTVAELFRGRYAIEERLRWNGLALIYRANRATDGAAVAVALLPLDCSDEPFRQALFEAATRPLESLSHPSLIGVQGHGIQHDVPFLEMEAAHGITIADIVAAGPLSIDRMKEIMTEVLRALEVVHEHGLRHLDLTPSNILIERDREGHERVRLIGTGLAELLRQARDDDTTGPTGRGSGTKATRYLAPEVLRGEVVDDRADVYSAGAVAYHLLTGKLPPRHADLPVAIGPEIPAEVGAAITRAMAPSPSGRYKSAAALRDALRPKPTIPPPSAGRRPSEHPTVRPPPIEQAASLPTPAAVPSTSGVPPAVSLPPGGTVPSTSPLSPAQAGASTRPGRGRNVAIIAGALVFVAGFAAYLVLFAMTDEEDVIEPTGLAANAAHEDGAAPDPSSPTASETEDGGRAARAVHFETTDIDVAELPPRIRPVASKILAGHRLERTELTELTRVARGNREMAASHLLLARAYMNLGWHSDAIQRYVIAWETDQEARRDAQMLADLVDLVQNEQSGPAAVEAIENIYGRDALEAIDDRLASPGLRPAGTQKLTQLRMQLARRR